MKKVLQCSWFKNLAHTNQNIPSNLNWAKIWCILLKYWSQRWCLNINKYLKTCFVPKHGAFYSNYKISGHCLSLVLWLLLVQLSRWVATHYNYKQSLESCINFRLNYNPKPLKSLFDSHIFETLCTGSLKSWPVRWKRKTTAWSPQPRL